MTTSHCPPTPGIWLRPVGRWYGYCLRVVRVYSPDTQDHLESVEFERWGLDTATQAPVRDEHANHLWCSGLLQVLPGVWRNTCGRHYEPLYYRAMDTCPYGQKELFA